jgi:predicted ATPase
VLIGPNDSGKSSFLEAIHRTARRQYERMDWHRGGPKEPDVQLSDLMRGDATELYKLPSEGIPMSSQGVEDQPGSTAPHLNQSGSNLAAFLDYLLRKDRRRFDQIQDALKKRVPGLEEISIFTPNRETRSISLKIEGGFEIEGERLSTGVRMLFFFVALAYHPDPPAVVLLEEPENGVHPKRLEDIVDLLRGLTEGRISGRPVQVILSTHSPYLLDHIRLPQDQVLVFQREPDGQRSATEADQTRLKAFLDEYMLGELWFNQGEEGLVATAR